MCVRERDRKRHTHTERRGRKSCLVLLWTVQFLIPVHAGSVRLGLPFVVWASLHHHRSYPLVCIGCLIFLVLCMLQYFPIAIFKKFSHNAVDSMHKALVLLNNVELSFVFFIYA